MAVRVYDFDKQVGRGKVGERLYADLMTARGHEVIDLSHDRHMRRRDIDLMVDQWTVEVKTDYHAPRALFAELTVNGKPGYIFTSRADLLVTYFPKGPLLVTVPPQALAWWVSTNARDFPIKVIHSRRRGAEWTAEGVVIQLAALREAGLSKEEWLTPPPVSAPWE